MKNFFLVFLSRAEAQKSFIWCFCRVQKREKVSFGVSVVCRSAKKFHLVFLSCAEAWKSSIWCFCRVQKREKVSFGVSVVCRSAKVVSRMVWHFRGWRKSFPEWFGISALGESRFPKGLAFPRLAKVISRVVWHFRARRKPSRNNLLKIVTINIHKWKCRSFWKQKSARQNECLAL